MLFVISNVWQIKRKIRRPLYRFTKLIYYFRAIDSVASQCHWFKGTAGGAFSPLQVEGFPAP
jgi:hypothetical protein